MSNDTMRNWLNIVPTEMRSDILAYKQLKDIKLRLAGRIILRHCLIKSNLLSLFNNLKRGIYNKPYIQGWLTFNTTHSGDFTVFCSNDSDIGVDIEQKGRLYDKSIIKYFHQQEQNFILSSSDSDTAFLDIWVKKEAFLKAIGFGVYLDLDLINCINESIEFDNKMWYFHKVLLHPSYTCYLCTNTPVLNIKITKFK